MGLSSLPRMREAEPSGLSAPLSLDKVVPMGLTTSAPAPGKEVPLGLTSSPGTGERKTGEIELAAIAVATVRSAAYKLSRESISEWKNLSERDRGMWLVRLRDGVLGAGKSLTMAKLAKMGRPHNGDGIESGETVLWALEFALSGTRELLCELQKLFMALGRNDETVVLDLCIGDLAVQAHQLEEDWLRQSNELFGPAKPSVEQLRLE